MDKNSIMNKAKFEFWLKNGKITQSAYGVLLNNGGMFETNKLKNEIKQLKISVAISTYKRPNLLIRLLDSIKSQKYDNIEVVIVDDCSKDETESVVEQYKLANAGLTIKFFVNEKNKGVGETKKKAFIGCTGDIIVFSDDDDYYIDNTYFLTLNQIYSGNPNCSMTVTDTIIYYENEEKYCLHELNFDHPISTVDYLNGFVYEYTKPPNLALSMSSKNAHAVELENLLYFNDSSLFLFGLLGTGMVFPINRAVGIYYKNGKNMTGNCKADFIIANLDAKEDIYNRAMAKNLLIAPKEWRKRNLRMTSNYYLLGNKDVKPGDLEVWKWIKSHFSFQEYYCYVLRVLLSRIKNGKSVNLRYIKLLK